jgi:hypothetical protein
VPTIISLIKTAYALNAPLFVILAETHLITAIPVKAANTKMA